MALNGAWPHPPGLPGLPRPGHTHHLVLEPQEVGAAEIPLSEEQRGVAFLQVSACQADQRPDLGRQGECSKLPLACGARPLLTVGPGLTQALASGRKALREGAPGRPGAAPAPPFP